MSLRQTIRGAIGGLCVLLVAVHTSQAQSAKLFVAENRFGESTQVYRFDVGPTGIPTLDLTITHPSLDAPYGIAFSATGEMFVVNRGFTHTPGNGSVSRFLDPAGTPVFNGTIASSSFSGPHGAVFRNGELLIAQRFGSNVLRFAFAPAGNALLNGAITAGLGGTAPRGVIVNPLTGELFVTQCCGVDQVNRYLVDAAGNAVPNGVITGGGLSNPHDMAFSPWGELFVASYGNNGVSRFLFDVAGNASPNGQITGNGLAGPIGLDFSPWGELFVSSADAPVISRWTFDASFNAIPNGSFATPQRLGDLQFFAAAGSSVEEELAALLAENAALQNQVSGLQSQVSLLTSENAALQGEIDVLTQQLSSLMTQINACIQEKGVLAGQITALTNQNATLASQNQALQVQAAALAAERDAVVRRLFERPADQVVAAATRDAARARLDAATAAAGSADRRVRRGERNYLDGLAALGAGEYERALREFRQAYRTADEVLGG